MPGFRVNRPDGSVAIDSSYFNLALRQKGSILLDETPNKNLPAFKGKTLVVGGDQCIIAYRSAQPVAVYSGLKQGNTFSYVFRGMNNNGPIWVEWYLFDLPGYGLQYTAGGKMIVRRPADGAVVFDSRMMYMKVQDFFSKTDLTRDYPYYPAVVMVNRAWYTRAQYSPYFVGVYQAGGTMARVEGNKVLIRTEVEAAYPLDPSDEQSYAWSGGYPAYLVLDVQNM